MPERPPAEVPAISAKPLAPGMKTGSDRMRGSRRNAPPSTGSGSLQTRDLESSGDGSTLSGCNSVFLSDPAFAEFLKYGGQDYSGANVELIFWGSAWLAPGASPTPGEVTAAIRALFQTSYFYPLKQYGVNVGKVDQSFTVTSPEPPANVGSDDITNMLWGLIGDRFPLPDEDGGRNIYVVFLPSTTKSTPDAGFDSAHSRTWHIHVDLPFNPIDVEWAYYAWIGWSSDVSGITLSVSHEVLETYTNPNTHDDNGWVVDFGGSDPQELCDVCPGSGTIDGIAVNSYFSRRDGACIIPGGQSLRLFLSTKGINPPVCLRQVLPPGMCLRQWMAS